MSKDKGPCDWDRRRVDFSKIHSDTSRGYDSLLGSLRLTEGMRLLDLMGGYGEVSGRVLKRARELEISMEVDLVDFSMMQLCKSYGYLGEFEPFSYKINRIRADARDYVPKETSLDAIIIKLGLHEVQRAFQPEILKRAYDGLREGGQLFVWDAFGENDTDNQYFNLIVKRKDELAGFETMARERYLPTREEITLELSKLSGDVVSCIGSGDFCVSGFYLADLGHDSLKVQEFNNYIRSLLPEATRKGVHFVDNGDSVDLTFRYGIFMVEKGMKGGDL